MIVRRRKRNIKAAPRAIRPNLGIESRYSKQLLALVDEMNASVVYWLKAEYRKAEPAVAKLALDEIPASVLRAAIRKLTRRWQGRFDEAAPRLAEYFSKSAGKRSDDALKRILKDAGFAIEFKMTAAQRDILEASVNENVALIKSIPAQYLTQVEGMVMRSVQTGRDLATLTTDLQTQFGVTRRRAEFIARDQNNKITSAFTRARQMEVGFTEAIWMHSRAGKEPRKTHVAENGKTYKIAEGWYDPAVKRNIWPGELPGCRCVCKPVLSSIKVEP